MIIMMSFLNIETHRADASVLGDFFKAIGEILGGVARVAKVVLDYENLKNALYTEIDRIQPDGASNNDMIIIYEGNSTSKLKLIELARAYHNSIEILTIEYAMKKSIKFSKEFSLSTGTAMSANAQVPMLDDIKIEAAIKLKSSVGETKERTVEKGEKYTVSVGEGSRAGIYALNINVVQKYYLIEYLVGVTELEVKKFEEIENGKTKTTITIQEHSKNYVLKKYFVTNQMFLKETDDQPAMSVDLEWILS
jgi:hypothetical protein